eukprot:4714396-Amphidinium_carterae.1
MLMQATNVVLNLVTAISFILSAALSRSYLWVRACGTLWGKYCPSVLENLRCIASLVTFMVVAVYASVAIRWSTFWVFLSCSNSAQFASAQTALFSTQSAISVSLLAVWLTDGLWGCIDDPTLTGPGVYRQMPGAHSSTRPHVDTMGHHQETLLDSTSGRAADQSKGGRKGFTKSHSANPGKGPPGPGNAQAHEAHDEEEDAALAAKGKGGGKKKRKNKKKASAHEAEGTDLIP